MRSSRVLGVLVVLAALAAVPRAAATRGIVGRVEVSKAAGLGRVELAGDTAAVVQRDEGIVALLDVSDPRAPKVVGRYDDGAVDSLDGDLVFSTDRHWLFYARQTREFSKDGIHVLDVSDPAHVRMTHYQPQGGTLRIAYFKGSGGEWVFSLDAIHGLVVNRFVPEAGLLVPVHIDALPALKVGGPASAGLFVERNDPITGSPLLYVATGRTGVQIFDISEPATPRLLGSWDEVGLAEIEVRATANSRTIYAATEYWFDKSLEPEIVVLDATTPNAIKKRATWSVGCPAEDRWRLQGMSLHGMGVMAAHSNWGLVRISHTSGTSSLPIVKATKNDSARVPGHAPYVFDVETRGGLLFVTDAANGYLTILRRDAPASGGSIEHADGSVSLRHCV